MSPKGDISLEQRNFAMKKRAIFFQQGLCVVCAFILASCFSPWKGGEGILTLYMDGTISSRISSPPDKTILEKLHYNIAIDGPTVLNLSSDGKAPIQVSVTPGIYTISVKAFLDSPDGNLYAEGILKNTKVNPGYNSAMIAMQRHFPFWISVADRPFGTEGSYCVTWGNGKYIAGGGDVAPIMAWSANGSDWQLVTSPPSFPDPLERLLFGDGTFVCTGMFGSAGISYSTDGLNWHDATINPPGLFSGALSMHLAYGGESGSKTFLALSGSAVRATSPDGVIWDSSSIFYGVPINDVAWGNGTFVAVGYTGSPTSGYIANSNDGSTWTTVANPFVSTSIYYVSFGNGIFIAVGINGDIAQSIDNGVNWTITAPSLFGGDSINGIAYGDGVFVVVGNSGKMAYSTDDGLTWLSFADSPFGTSNIGSITYGDGRFVAMGYDGKIAYSVMP